MTTASESFSDDGNGLFDIQFSTSLRNFKSQHSGPSMGIVSFTCISLDDFRDKLFNRIKHHLKRQVNFSETMVPQWAEKEQPDIDDLNEFVGFCNKISKRVIPMENVTTRSFMSWFEDQHPICLQIYSYSRSVANQTLYAAVQKTLLLPETCDRANASSTSVLLEMTQRLKSIHSETYYSADINWMLWADYILSKPAHEHETLINRGPPSELIHLFASIRSNPEQHLMNIRQNLSIGKEINVDSMTTVQELTRTYEELKKVHERSGELISHFGSLLEASHERLNARVGLIDAFQTAVEPVEYPFGRQILQNVENVPDLDHNETDANNGQNVQDFYGPEDDYIEYESLEQTESRYMQN